MTTTREPFGRSWLQGLDDEFDRQFPDKSKEDEEARQAVEERGERPAEQGRYQA